MIFFRGGNRPLLVLKSLYVLICGQAYAGEIMVEVTDRRPESYFNGRHFVGPVIEMTELVLQAAGLRAKYVEIPWARSLAKAKVGISGMLLRHSMNEERRDFLRPILYGYEERKVRFIRHKQSAIAVTRYLDLAKYQIGVRRASHYWPQFNTDQSLTKVLINTDKQVVGMLARQRIDLAITNNVDDFKIHSAELGIHFDDVFEVIEYHHSYFNGRYLSLSVGSIYEPYFEQINCQMWQLRRDGFIDKLFLDAGLAPLIQHLDNEESRIQQLSC